MINDQYPRKAWTHVYTDGSATRAVTNGGAGIVILENEKHIIMQQPEHTVAITKQRLKLS